MKCLSQQEKGACQNGVFSHPGKGPDSSSTDALKGSATAGVFVKGEKNLVRRRKKTILARDGDPRIKKTKPKKTSGSRKGKGGLFWGVCLLEAPKKDPMLRPALRAKTVHRSAFPSVRKTRER